MKTFILLVLFFCFVGCSAQQTVQQVPLKQTVAKVTTIISDQAVIQPYGSPISYTVPVPEGPLNVGWEYVFWLEVTNGESPNKKAAIVAYAVTTTQARKNQEAIAKQFSNRRVIK